MQRKKEVKSGTFYVGKIMIEPPGSRSMALKVSNVLDVPIVPLSVTSYRPHRTLGLRTPSVPPFLAVSPIGVGIVARPVLGGLHHEYEWEAA